MQCVVLIILLLLICFKEWLTYFLPQKLCTRYSTIDDTVGNAADFPTTALASRNVKKHNIDFNKLFRHKSSHGNTDKKRANETKSEQRRHQKNSQQIGVKAKGSSTNRLPPATATMTTMHSKNSIAR